MPSSPGYKELIKFCEVCGTQLKLKSERDVDRKKTCGNVCRGILSAKNRILLTCECQECGCEFTCKVRAKRCDTCRDNANLQISRSYSMMHNRPEKYFKHALYKKGREGLTVDYMLDLLEKQNGLCAISKQPLTFIKIVGNGRVGTNASIDQIRAGKGYIHGNVQIVCDAVNRMKLDLDKDELMFWCEHILANQKEWNDS